jgi:hypothetical protein
MNVFNFSSTMFVVVVVVTGTTSGAPVRGLEAAASSTTPKFAVRIDCERPKSDLSDLLSAGYRAVAQPDGFNHVSFSR